MPVRHPLQMTFEAGEISPLVYSRSDLPGYHKGAILIENMLPNARGPVESRNGFEYKQDVADPTDTDGRLFTFRVDYSTTFIVAITESEVWITDQNGLVESDNKVDNGSFDDGGTDWDTDTNNGGTVTFSASKAHLVTAAVPNSTALIKQNVTGLVIGNTHILRVNGTMTGGYGGDGRIRIGTTEGGTEVLDRFYGGGNVEYTFTPTTTNVWVEVEAESVQIEQEPGPTFFWVATAAHIDAIIVVDRVVVPDAGSVTFASPYGVDDLAEIQAEMAPDRKEMIFVHRNVSPRELKYDTSVVPAVWTFNTIAFDPADPFGDDEEPGAITFHQGRMILASTYSRPVTIWASAPGRDSYYDFKKNASDSRDDGLEVTLARNADIQWIKGSKVLYVGCDNSEHIVRSNEPAISVLDIEVNQQSSYGSARINSDWISETVSYVSYDGRRLRMTAYQTNSGNLESKDITWGAEHITESLVTEVHQTSNPQNILICVMADGGFTSCTYDDTFNAMAWARHSVDGNIRSMTVADEQGVSVLYALVYRDGKLRLDRVANKKIFMDEYIERAYVTATNTVDGLDHLEGKTVQVIADGSQRIDAVVASGEITVSGPAAFEFVVGLQMFRRLKTVKVDNPSAYGATASFKKRWSEIFLRLHQSSIPKINGKREASRTPQDQMDIVAPLTTEDIKVNNLGWGDGTIFIEQDLPFDLNIVGIFGRISEESL